MRGSLLRASAVMASGTLVSRVLGFAKAILLASALGQVQSVSGDAFANGNLLPNTLYMILLGGMLNAVLVPQIVKAAKDDDGGAGYINRVFTLVMSALVVVTVVVLLLAPWITWLFTVSWDDEQRALAVAFAYWCLPQIVFYGLYTMLGEVLNAKEVFGPFTWAPVLNNVVAIAGIVLFMLLYGADPNGTREPADWSPAAIAVLAGSATLGVALQAVVLFISWRRAGITYRPDFRWRGMGLGDTFRVASWGLATILVMQLGGIVTNNVINTASGHGASALAMQNAWLLFMMPHSVVAVSLVTAYFTRLSGWGQQGLLAEFKQDFLQAGKQIVLLMVLATVAIFAAAPFIARVMNIGVDSHLVAEFSAVLRCYVVGLVAYSFLFLVQRAFYALGDTKTPFFFTSAQIVLLVLLSLLMLLLPKQLLGPVYALVWGLTTVLECLLAMWLLGKRIGGLPLYSLLQTIVRALLALVPALGGGLLLCWGMQKLFPSDGVLFAVLGGAVVGISVVALYGLVLVLLRAPELKDVVGSLSGKIGGRGARR